MRRTPVVNLKLKLSFRFPKRRSHTPNPEKVVKSLSQHVHFFNQNRMAKSNYITAVKLLHFVNLVWNYKASLQKYLSDRTNFLPMEGLRVIVAVRRLP